MNAERRTLDRMRKLALVFGICTPIAEVVRRWGELWDYPPALLDDFFLGGFLIAGAFAAREGGSLRGRALLASAWGFACGIAYNSISFQWLGMQAGEADPAPIPTEAVFGIKLAGGVVFAVALVLTVFGDRSRVERP